MNEVNIQFLFISLYTLTKMLDLQTNSISFTEDFEIDTLHTNLDKLENEIRNLHIDSASLDAVIKRLRTNLWIGRNRSFAQEYAGKLYSILFDELSRSFCLSLPLPDRKLYENSSPLFGDQVKTSFPSLTFEIEEIGKCLALDRSTAAAFHMLRCLEGAIRAISRCLSIPDPTKGTDRSWGKALGTIRTEIDKKWPPQTRISGDGVLFERFHATLAAMQNPYRNATMHLEHVRFNLVHILQPGSSWRIRWV